MYASRFGVAAGLAFALVTTSPLAQQMPTEKPRQLSLANRP
jgi:hypothetical protein